MGFFNEPLRSWKTSLLYTASFALGLPTATKRAPWKHVQTTTYGDVAFGLGNVTYLANIRYPKAVLSGDCSAAASAAAGEVGSSSLVPLTVIFTEEDVVTGAYLEGIVARYLEGDDVFSEDFLEGVLVAYNGTGGTSVLDDSALNYLNSFSPNHLFLDTRFEKRGGRMLKISSRRRNVSLCPHPSPFIHAHAVGLLTWIRLDLH